jgi:molybdate transport system substrate-binding protein
MRMSSFGTAIKVGFFMLLAQGVAVEAAEIKVLNTAALTALMNELGPQFERQSGHKVVMKTEVSAALRRQIDTGETFDVAVLNPSHVDDLIKVGKIAPDTRTDIARAGVGVGIRSGAPNPDISSVEAFKRTLLNAKSVAHSKEGASGVHFAGLIERLGIAEEMKPKLKPMGGGAVVQTVATGEAEIVVVVIPPILAMPGVELVGPLPSELQTYVGFTAGVSPNAKEPDAAKALINFLTAPEAVAVIKAKGMEPVAR